MKSEIKHLLLVLVGFPLLYIGLTLTPLSTGLFVDNNPDCYIPFWGAVVILHWVTFFIVLRILRPEKLTLRDIGYRLSVKRTIVLVISLLAVALGVFGFTEMTLKSVGVDQAVLSSMGSFFPKTTTQRLFYIFVVFTASFCEEIIYRGYALTRLRSIGMNRWAALIPAGISFVFIHGINGYFQFWFYFAAALVFGLIFITSKRLWPGIVLHFIFDIVAMMAVFNAVS